MTITKILTAFALFSMVACGGRYDGSADGSASDRAIIVDAGDAGQAAPVPLRCDVVRFDPTYENDDHGRYLITQNSDAVPGCDKTENAGEFTCPETWCTYTAGTCPECSENGE
jgi:hypothetical protein